MKSKELLAKLQAARADIKSYKEKRLGASTSAAAPSAGLNASCAKFGAKSFNDLIRVNTADRKFKHIPLEEREAVKSLKEAVDVAIMTAKYFGKSVQDTLAYSEMVEPALKALGDTTAGGNWIPTQISDSYIDEYNLERKVASLFTEIKMPSSPYQHPVLSNGAIATKLAQGTQKSSKDQFTSSVITFTAVKLSNQYELPEELQEDSAVDVMKVLRQELIEGQEKSMEIAILEGDVTGTHQHTNTGIPGQSGAPASDSPERVFNGLRKKALANSATVDCGGNPTNEAKLSELRAKLGKYGVNPAELALICGVKGYNQLMALDDVRTMEQLGPKATVLTGQLASYEGIPVIVSEWLREDTSAATGVNGASANTKATMLMVNRKRFFTGIRRAIQVRVENNRTAFDTWDMVSFSRRDFQGVAQSASEISVALLVNIGT